jgi:caffeoyl-CoA O-methyltransferase
VIVDPNIETYAEAHTTRAPAHLEELARETEANLPIPEMFSGPVVGRLLQTLVALRQPRLVLEIGTYSGGAAQWMAGALPPGGKLITCELDPEIAAFAQRHIDAAGLGEVVEIRVGPALETVASLDGPFDVVFIDADKPGYAGYLDAVLPKLADNGVVIADNTLRGGRIGDPQNEGDHAMAAFNDRVVNDPGLIAVQLTVRDGVTLIRKA